MHILSGKEEKSGPISHQYEAYALHIPGRPSGAPVPVLRALTLGISYSPARPFFQFDQKSVQKIPG